MVGSRPRWLSVSGNTSCSGAPVRQAVTRLDWTIRKKVLLRCNHWRCGSRQNRPSCVFCAQAPEDEAAGIVIAQAFDSARDGD